MKEDDEMREGALPLEDDDDEEDEGEDDDEEDEGEDDEDDGARAASLVVACRGDAAAPRLFQSTAARRRGSF